MSVAACKSCKHVYKYNSKTDPSTMARYRCNIISNNQIFIFAPVSRTVSLHGSTGPSLTEMKDKMTNACVNMCSVDLRPFDSIAGE